MKSAVTWVEMWFLLFYILQTYLLVMTSPNGVSFDSVEDLIPRAEIFRSKLIEDFQLLDSINKTTTEVPKYYSSELSGKPTLCGTVKSHYSKIELRLLREFLYYFVALIWFLGCLFRDAFRTLPNIYNWTFCKNSWQLKAKGFTKSSIIDVC